MYFLDGSLKWESEINWAERIIKVYTRIKHRVLEIESRANPMNIVGCSFEMVLTVALCVFFSVTVHAEQILHHGIAVESEGTAQDCLLCHDGYMTSSAFSYTVRSSHSILKNYPPVRDRRRYAPVAAVRMRGVKIVNGKITCISCHNLKNPEKFHLAVEKSKLCVICHIAW